MFGFAIRKEITNIIMVTTAANINPYHCNDGILLFSSLHFRYLDYFRNVPWISTDWNAINPLCLEYTCWLHNWRQKLSNSRKIYIAPWESTHIYHWMRLFAWLESTMFMSKCSNFMKSSKLPCHLNYSSCSACNTKTFCIVYIDFMTYLFASFFFHSRVCCLKNRSSIFPPIINKTLHCDLFPLWNKIYAHTVPTYASKNPIHLECKAIENMWRT